MSRLIDRSSDDWLTYLRDDTLQGMLEVSDSEDPIVVDQCKRIWVTFREKQRDTSISVLSSIVHPLVSFCLDIVIDLTVLLDSSEVWCDQ